VPTTTIAQQAHYLVACQIGPIVRDGETVYTLSYAAHGAPFAGKAPPRDVKKAEEILAAEFGGVRLEVNR
jgi:hypothetical protein